MKGIVKVIGSYLVHNRIYSVSYNKNVVDGLGGFGYNFLTALLLIVHPETDFLFKANLHPQLLECGPVVF